MSAPTLTPTSTLSAIVLPITGSSLNVNSALPYKIYSDESSTMYSSEFISGAVDQVSYVYKKLGGDVLDLEITEGNVYSAYEESVLEYSYLVNLHQATNILSDALGNSTGSFDSKGNLESGALSSSLGGKHVALKYPKFDYSMTRRVAEGVGSEVGLNGSVQYSASFDVTSGQQDYDLQQIISSRTNVPAVGSLTFQASPANGNSFTLVDAKGKTQIFTFSTSTNQHSNGTIGIAAASVAGGGDAGKATSVAIQVVEAITQFEIEITAKVNDSDTKIIDLTQDVGGSAGNTTITDQSDNMTVTSFASGVTNFPYANDLQGKKILIKKVFYKTPHAMWRFFGYYGGLNVVGNLHNYGQFSDDSTFQLVPAWQNKSQALAFEDAIYTRMSHYSYELKNNKIRLYPRPYGGGPRKMWIEFSIPTDVWDNDDKSTDGINNMNTLPIGNLPFGSINSIGKQWIRRFALSLCKETLGQVRSKFSSVPIPGESVTLNGTALISEGKDEQSKLRDELKQTLTELTYAKLAEQDAGLLENTEKVLQKVPYNIYVG